MLYLEVLCLEVLYLGVVVSSVQCGESVRLCEC